MAACHQLPQCFGALVTPCGEVGVHALNKGGELWMAVDRGFDGDLLHGQIDVATAIRLEQYLPKIRTDLPVAAESIHVPLRNATTQVAFHVLSIFCLLAVDVTRE